MHRHRMTSHHIESHDTMIWCDLIRLDFVCLDVRFGCWSCFFLVWHDKMKCHLCSNISQRQQGF